MSSEAPDAGLPTTTVPSVPEGGEPGDESDSDRGGEGEDGVFSHDGEPIGLGEVLDLGDGDGAEWLKVRTFSRFLIMAQKRRNAFNQNVARQLVSRLRALCQESDVRENLEVELKVFGSMSMGVSTACSDVDVKILVSTDDIKEALELLLRIARRLSAVEGVTGALDSWKSIERKHTLEFSFNGFKCDLSVGSTSDPWSWTPMHNSHMIHTAVSRLDKHERAAMELFSISMKFIGPVQSKTTIREGRMKNICSEIFALEAVRQIAREDEDDEVKILILMLDWFVHFDFARNMILIDQFTGETMTSPKEEHHLQMQRDNRNGFLIERVGATLDSHDDNVSSTSHSTEVQPVPGGTNDDDDRASRLLDANRHRRMSRRT